MQHLKATPQCNISMPYITLSYLSPKVTSALSKDSRMSTMANEDPEESANRLVPKSLANSFNHNEPSSTTATSTASNDTSKTTDSNRGPAFFDGWQRGNNEDFVCVRACVRAFLWLGCKQLYLVD